MQFLTQVVYILPMEVILRRVNATSKSVEEALSLLQRVNSRIISTSGVNVLAQIDATRFPWLQHQLSGWILAPQGVRAPIPDARIKVDNTA